MLSPTRFATHSQSTATSSQPSLPPSSTLRLFLSARDLPEPDRRSHACYAVIYLCEERVVPPLRADAHHALLKSTSSARRSRPDPVHFDKRLVRHAARLLRHSSRPQSLRAPRLAAVYTAPQQPTLHVRHDGVHVVRTSWSVVGVSDIARKNGRDVELAQSFYLHYDASRVQLLRVAFYDGTKLQQHKQRLIATADCVLSSAVAAYGKPLPCELSFVPVSEKDHKKSARIPTGTLLLSAQSVTDEPQQFRIDVQCSRILRARSLSYSYVKRMFYTIHAILDDHPKSDLWTLVYRSHTVGMIAAKKDGGSLQYNYFSCRRVIARPGVIIEDTHAPKESDNAPVGLFQNVMSALGLYQAKSFFSLPGADIYLHSSDTRLKLTLYEDNGSAAGYDMIADSEFTFADLQGKELGHSSPIKMRTNIVGKAVLKYKECSPDPHYFCLSLLMRAPR